MDYLKLAELLLPDTYMSTKEILEIYPRRNLPSDAKVTRFAPSPTGFLHMGGLFAAIISERLAHQSRGVFYLRIEDTDKKREVKGSIPEIIKSLAYFGISFDEGEVTHQNEVGDYGPYKQSLRKRTYCAFVKELLAASLAYPCFCSAQDLDNMRSCQKTENTLTGYYGDWAKCRDLTIEEVQQNLAAGKSFVIRLKSPGNPDGKIVFKDLVKGEIRLPENIQDIVILKSDGLPTYHFAHAVDDYLMCTTHIFRGDEWLPSVPIHLQLFQVLGWNPPLYGHISPIMKMDGVSKRKFSKRKDPEFAVSWYREQGYTGTAVTEYLLGLANSSFEEWRIKNPSEHYNKFLLTIEKMSVSGALFDINKFNDVCKNVLAALSGDEMYKELTAWTSIFDRDFHELITTNKDYTMNILNIGRGTNKPRKDFAKLSDIKPAISYFYDELYDAAPVQNGFPVSLNSTDVKDIICTYTSKYDKNDDNTIWFEKIKDLCRQLGYAEDMKTFKKAPTAFKGHIGDVAMILRIALTGRTNTPDLFEIMQVMGENRIFERLNRYI